MKSLKFIVIGMVLSLTNIAQSQVSVSLSFGSPPSWGPAGYDDVRYYYLPDVEAYYDVQSSMFIYFDGGAWIRRAYLPDRYRNYDLYGGYKVVLKDYRGNNPYVHFVDHRSNFRRGYHGETQRTIGERPDQSRRTDTRQVEKHENRESFRGKGKESVRSNDKGNDKGNVQGNDKGNSRRNDTKKENVDQGKGKDRKR